MLRKLAKNIILGIGYILVAPAGWSARLVHRVFRSQRLFHMFGDALAPAPGYPGQVLRACYYFQTLEEAHLDTVFSFMARVTNISTKIGSGVILGGFATVGYSVLHDRAVIGNYANVLSGRYQHNFSTPDKGVMEGETRLTLTVIGNDTFVGDGCTVMADVGEKSVIGAGAVVVKPIPSLSVAVGNPARVVKKRES